ncbi:MAG: hypothetical protein C5B59_11130 [Bacteroidetes bacterium]|nr:MAG: hypothetical protein C5B59_11130 [Bacteroidota bacterium]
MKKFYLICAILLMCAKWGEGQNYTAIFSGNWTDASIWGPSGIPSNPCTNCNITINDGVIVTLNISFVMRGSSRLTIGSAGLHNATLNIPASNGTSISTGHNLILSIMGGGNPTVSFPTAQSHLIFTQPPGISAAYDGVFSQHGTYTKLIGIGPVVEIAGNGVNDNTHAGQTVIFGTSLPNAMHPAPFVLNANGTLPVTLIDFYGLLNDKVINLSWATSMEINSDHFDVERSRDAASWQAIGTVAAKGFSSVEADYSFTDGSPFSGVNYYRLKMVDKDGAFKYSPVAAVRGSVSQGLRLFPNPASSFVNISFGNDVNGHMNIRMINQFGQLLMEKNITQANNMTVSLQVGSFAQGIYMVQLKDDNGNSQTLRFLIAR